MIKFILSLFFLLSVCLPTYSIQEGAVLQARIETSTVDPNSNKEGKIQPGSAIVLHAIIKNTGTEANASGEIQLRFMFCNPLENHPKSLLFETEKLCLPSIAPQESVTLTFAKHHIWPSIFDYIRYDWGMREYHAVVTFDGEEQIIGIMPISFSAYYYDSNKREIPKAVPSF